MKRVLLLAPNGCEEIEALTVVDILRRGNIDVDIASVSGEEIIRGAHNIEFISDISLEYINFDNYDGFILPGGYPGYESLKNSETVKEVVLKAVKKSRLVAAICAAPTVLGHFDVLRGKRACCYPGMEDGLIGAVPVENSVVVDGHIITSRGMGTAIEFSLAILEYLTDKDTAVSLAKAIVWKY